MTLIKQSGGQVLWGLADHQGTIRDVVEHDGPDTVLVNQVQYDSFGNPTESTAPIADFLFAFTGRPLDPHTNLYDYRARWYDPQVGRFLSEDPIASDSNLYRYCGNSPLMNVDPSGLCFSSLSSAFNSVSSAFQGVVSTATSIATSMGTAASQWTTQTFGNVPDAWSTSSFSSAFQNAVSTASGFTNTVASGITSTLQSTTQALSSIGSAFASPLARAIGSMLPVARDSMTLQAQLDGFRSYGFNDEQIRQAYTAQSLRLGSDWGLFDTPGAPTMQAAPGPNSGVYSREAQIRLAVMDAEWARTITPEDPDSPAKVAIRGALYDAQGTMNGWLYDSPWQDDHVVFRAAGHLPLVGIGALALDAGICYYHGEYEEALRSVTFAGGNALVSYSLLRAPSAQPNRIYSSRVLLRSAEETGPFHNFPQSFDQHVFSEGSRTVVPNYWRTPKVGLSNDAIMYRLPGSVTLKGNVPGVPKVVEGVYELGVRPSPSGNTEVIMHRFFNPNR